MRNTDLKKNNFAQRISDRLRGLVGSSWLLCVPALIEHMFNRLIVFPQSSWHNHKPALEFIDIDIAPLKRRKIATVKLQEAGPGCSCALPCKEVHSLTSRCLTPPRRVKGSLPCSNRWLLKVKTSPGCNRWVSYEQSCCYSYCTDNILLTYCQWWVLEHLSQQSVSIKILLHLMLHGHNAIIDSIILIRNLTHLWNV